LAELALFAREGEHGNLNGIQAYNSRLARVGENQGGVARQHLGQENSPADFSLAF
jgi:hypothetical protein